MPFDLFISYAHKDNARGQVHELCDAIRADFKEFAGRELGVFFDEHDIPSMADWEKRIAHGLSESRLFLAVLSPNYFASVYCRREWEEYVRYEAMRQCLGEGVAPVYFIELPGIDAAGTSGGPNVEQSIAAAVDAMRKRQWCDLRPWHLAGKRALEDVEVARRLRVLKEQLAERLSRADRTRQSPTNIYRHNPQFVGRVRELTLLREAVKERGSVGVVGHKTTAGHGASKPATAAGAGAAAVHGVGGMGKTELALAYAHAFGWDYPGGRWLARCENLDTFDQVLYQLAEPLGVTFTDDEKKDIRRAAERMLAELRRRDRSLLLLDNVTSPALLSPDVLMRLPAQGHVHVIATTRLGPAQVAGSPHDHTFVAVDELPEADALALIRAHQPEARFANADDEAAARELVALLAGFTLAVETAAIYLGRHPAAGAIAAYTDRLRGELLAASEAAAADPVVAVRHKEKLLERTLAVTFETLSGEELHVLTLASLLPADQVALPWLRALAGETYPAFKPEAGAPATAADAAWNQLVNSLLSLRLFQPGGDMRIVRVHRMVQELLRRKLPAEELAVRHRAINHLVTERTTALEGTTLWESARWELEPYEALANLWADTTHPRAGWLLNQAGLFWCYLAEHTRGEPLMRRALAIDEKSFGKDHADVARDLNNLAQLLQATNRLVEAEPLVRQVVGILEKSFNKSSPELAVALNNFALLLRATNRLTEAEPLMRRALAIDEQSLGKDHPSVARDLNNLAALLQDTNRLAEAEPLMRRVADIFQKSLGENHPNVAAALNNLALLLQATNRLAEAEPLYWRALAINELSFGKDHPNVAKGLNNLALLMQIANRLAEAESLMRRALATDEQSLGKDHPSVALALNNLALLLHTTNRLAEAEPLMRRALTIDEQSYGRDHPDVARDLNNLARLLQDTNRLAEAELLMARVVSIFERSLGENHPNVATALNNLALLLHTANRLAEAEPLMRRAFDILLKFKQATGHPHPHSRLFRANYSGLLTRMGICQAQVLAHLNALAQPYGIQLGD